MNNFENELFAILEDLLSNRQKDISGEVVKYCKSDIEKYIEIIKNIENKIDSNIEKNNSSKELLKSIYLAIVKILEQNKI